MLRVRITALIGAAVMAGLATQACAGPYDGEPQVVPGIGPEVAGSYAPRPVAPHRPNYGGGLIEMMMTGAASDRATPAAPAPRIYATAGATYTAYGSGAVQADPYGNALYPTRPGKTMDPIYQRQEVSYEGGQSPGTIVIDTNNKFLYLVEAPGRAMRYGIGVGRPGFIWTGTKTITRKAEWPDWTPPPEMLQRRPDLPSHMDGGIANPLGARAMYLGSSLYRIHGTNEPETIGTNVSSGCIRLTNEDVADLYGRVRVGTRVMVL